MKCPGQSIEIESRLVRVAWAFDSDFGSGHDLRVVGSSAVFTLAMEPV